MAQRKLTLEHLTQLYKLLTSEDVEVVEAEDDISFNEDELLQLIDGNRKPIISQQIKSELENEIHKSTSGKISAAVRKSLIDATGIDAKTLESLDTKEAVKAALEHYGKSFSGDKEASAKQINEIIEKHTAELAQIASEREMEKSNFISQIEDFSVENILGNLYSNAAGIDSKLDKGVLKGDFKSWLKSNYNVRVSEDKKGILLYDKTNPDKLAMNEAGTKTLNLTELHKNYHTQRGQWHEDNRKINPAEALPKIEHTKLENGKPVSVNEQVNNLMMSKLGMA